MQLANYRNSVNRSQTSPRGGVLARQQNKQASFNQAMQDYCKYRWHAFKFLKDRIEGPLEDYKILDLEDY